MRIFLDASTHGSGGYVAHLKGILSSGAITGDVSVVVACSPEMAARLGSRDPGVELAVDAALSGAVGQQHRWRKRRLPQLLMKHRADILFNPAGLLTRTNGLDVPRVTISRNLLPFSPNEVSRYKPPSKTRIRLDLLRRAQTRSFRLADGVIFPSEYARLVVSKRVRVQHWKVIPHGVDRVFFLRPRAGPIHRKDGEIRLLYASTVRLYKHEWHVLSAVERLRADTKRDIQLDFVGDGEARAVSFLEKKIRELGRPRYVRYLSGVPHEEMPQIYGRADLFVFASTCESFGITLVEAMASGLPIACSRCRPMTDILKDGGVFFEPENPASIANSIRCLIENPDVRLRCAERAYSYAQNYSWARCAKETFAFLRDIVIKRVAVKGEQHGQNSEGS